MPRDYAKKKAPQKKRGASRKRKDNKQIPLTLWLVTIVLVSGLVSGLIYLKWFSKAPSNSAQSTTINQPVRSTAESGNNTDNKPEDGQEKEEKIPLYELHEDLINKEVKISEEAIRQPENTNQYYYLMPCGSFRAKFRAEELKAKIALTGNNSKILIIRYQEEDWHRVQLGPFNRKRAAESVRHRLKDNDIHGCRIDRHLVNKK